MLVLSFKSQYGSFILFLIVVNMNGFVLIAVKYRVRENSVVRC